MINYDENPELNITPLVDIMLVLLAILMVAMPALIYEEKIIVPQGTQSKSKPMDKKALTIRITLDRKVYIDKDIFELSALADRLVLLQSQYSTDSQVYLKADENLRYGDVMSVLRSLKLAQYNNVALETR
ncbi:MAG: biopolymer transporter ExbD [Campylobacter sp.]|uniref:ExbD/TolR family protein n=1 Tax=Campylobacter sp. TaxID=205 RepID=UPI002A93A2C2|nr:biopolymer transporter ExbD [Campylobacter sp.]MCI6695127.1 biopolymer transporter ExbD [Campylobacter sp.]MCI6818828.1 biopolymer transporter ExbD [Campylobacter sp.]MCI7362633.1 biopolymer transporter ExbD [Campylobacter sp.]MCI7463912.1 biopolymer transporter ExbD [Campylobacter sp.]MDY6124021.1 biopolymer transporter ExbD [Campylobacter sp.]